MTDTTTTFVPAFVLSRTIDAHGGQLTTVAANVIDAAQTLDMKFSRGRPVGLVPLRRICGKFLRVLADEFDAAIASMEAAGLIEILRPEQQSPQVQLLTHFRGRTNGEKYNGVGVPCDPIEPSLSDWVMRFEGLCREERQLLETCRLSDPHFTIGGSTPRHCVKALAFARFKLGRLSLKKYTKSLRERQIIREVPYERGLTSLQLVGFESSPAVPEAKPRAVPPPRRRASLLRRVAAMLW